jgi:TIR domain
MWRQFGSRSPKLSTLSTIEKRTLEKFLQMGSGYVLDFSNRTFQEFVLEKTGIDIDNEETGSVGSIANRLRYFWKTQPDHVVGKLLNDFADYAEDDSLLKQHCRIIASRLVRGHRVTTPTDQKRIWGDEGFRVFLSHKAGVKKETAELKERLALFGISAFVAHTDIKPTKEWQEEIENALASMQAFVALLTSTFHESDWTDQEVGYALARGVPLIAVKLGLNPYGFIGKFQALSCDWNNAPLEIAKLLIEQPQMIDAFVDAAPRCGSYDNGNLLSELLPRVEVLTDKQAEQLASAFNKSVQLQGSYGFNGKKQWKFGPGLASHLTRMTEKEYVTTGSAIPGVATLQVKLKK